MDFNIQTYIDKIKKNIPEYQDKQVCIDIIKKNIPNITIDSDDIDIKKGVLFLKHLSPIHRTQIKMHKKKYIQDINNSKIYLRDIV